MTAKSEASSPDFLTPDELAQEADDREWRQVSEEDVEEIKFTFDDMGESFIGVYRKQRIVDGAEGKFTQYIFDVDNLRYFINAGWNLIQGMQKVTPGQKCRITWISNRDTGQETPMRIFRVDVAKPQSGTTATRSTGKR